MQDGTPRSRPLPLQLADMRHATHGLSTRALSPAYQAYPGPWPAVPGADRSASRGLAAAPWVRRGLGWRGHGGAAHRPHRLRDRALRPGAAARSVAVRRQAPGRTAQPAAYPSAPAGDDAFTATAIYRSWYLHPRTLPGLRRAAAGSLHRHPRPGRAESGKSDWLAAGLPPGGPRSWPGWSPAARWRAPARTLRRTRRCSRLQDCGFGPVVALNHSLAHSRAVAFILQAVSVRTPNELGVVRFPCCAALGGLLGPEQAGSGQRFTGSRRGCWRAIGRGEVSGCPPGGAGACAGRWPGDGVWGG